MRPFRPLTAPRGAWVIALLLAIGTFGLYGFTTGQLVGYEGETAAVTQALVQQGTLQVLPGNGFTSEGIAGRDGRRFSRTGLTQPLLEAPFYLVGDAVDAVASGGRNQKWRLAALRLFDPAMAVLTVLGAFGLLLLRGVERRRATVVALLLAVGSLVWPYAKIGMDTTLMGMVALAMVAAAWAADRPTASRMAAVGAAAALATSTKPYGLLLLVGTVPLLLGPWRALPARDRRRSLAALIVPLALGIVSVGWYNAYRSGSVTNFLHPNPTALVSSPLNVLGLLVSPGRGLLFYSPLVLLGAIGLRDLWRQDRALALAVVLPLAVNVLIIGATLVWTDDTWGPRYIVPTAWLLVLPIAWWWRGVARRRVLAGVAAVAVVVQGLGVFAPYGAATVATRQLTGVTVWPIGVTAGGPIPYGGDGPRWVPELSPIILNGEMLAAWVGRQVLGHGFTVTYDPTWGTGHQLNLDDPGRAVHAFLPDLWWRFPGQSAALDALAALLGLMALGGAAGLARVLRTRVPRPLTPRAAGAPVLGEAVLPSPA